MGVLWFQCMLFAAPIKLAWFSIRHTTHASITLGITQELLSILIGNSRIQANNTGRKQSILIKRQSIITLLKLKLTLRIEGSGNGHWIGWSLSRGSEGRSTGLNSVAISIPWGTADADADAAAATAPLVVSEAGANTSLPSCKLTNNSSQVQRILTKIAS